jgi:hypothetical protein
LDARCASPYHSSAGDVLAPLNLKESNTMQAAVDPVTGYSSRSTVGDAGLVSGPSSVSAVSWPAIFAGTVVAAAASLVLVVVGAGIGFGSLSPWPNAGATVTEFTAMTAVGLVLVQWLSAGIGGYVTGRLRSRWTGLHTHEVFFRDTAHGLITWATSTLVVSTALALAAASAAGAAAHGVAAAGAAASAGAGAAASSASSHSSIDPYDVDTLLRPQTPDASAQNRPEAAVQATRILGAGLATGDVPAADQQYLQQVVTTQTQLSAADAKTRVDAAVAKVKAAHDKTLQAADAARKATSEASLVTALAMILGAFIACIAAALGGHRREVHA